MLFRKLLLAVLILIAIQLQIRLWIGENSFAHVDGLSEKVEQKKSELGIKEQRNRILTVETRDLKQSLESIEETARSELGMIKEGETFFLVLDGKY